MENNAATYHEYIYKFLVEEVICSLKWLDLEKGLLEYKNLGQKKTNFIRDEIVTLCACEIAGGDIEKAIPAASSWVLYRIAATILDTIQDEHPQEVFWFKNGKSEAMNLAMSMLTLAQVSLTYLDLETNLSNKIARQLGYTYSKLALGQTQKFELDHLSEKSYISMVFNKAGNFLGTGFWLGGIIGSPQTMMPDLLYEYGLSVGLKSQILDDCEDISEDIRNRDYSLPVIFALSAQESTKSTHLKKLLLQDSLNKNEYAEIEKLVIDLDGVKKALYTASQYQKKAKKCLESLPDGQAKAWIKYYVA